MSRCFYYAVRLKDGSPQILVSTVGNSADLDNQNTKLLPERRFVWDTGLPSLEWSTPEGQASQAAIAILGHATTAPALTRRYAQRFQTLFLDGFPRQGWSCRADEVRSWVAQQRRSDRKLQLQTISKTRPDKY